MKSEIDVYAAYKISKFCKKNDIKILHLHTAHALSIGLLTKLFMKSLKLIGVRRVDFHINNKISKFLKYNNPSLDRIICISNGIRAVLLGDGVKSYKLCTIHSGIDTHKFDEIKKDTQFRSTYNIPENDVIVGTVAAIVDHKDYPNLLKAAKIVLEKKDNITFIALGEGELENDMKKMAKEFKILNKFHFLGFKKNIGPILKNFSLFVMPSKWEGLGTSILDAQAAGIPVIATHTGGIPEIIKHNKNGLLISPRNSKELANSILFLSENKNLRTKLSQGAREFVRDFNISKTVQNNIVLYKELL
jgi:glycosyltransferase involved in cell wall biosynthesis